MWVDDALARAITWSWCEVGPLLEIASLPIGACDVHDVAQIETARVEPTNRTYNTEILASPSVVHGMTPDGVAIRYLGKRTAVHGQRNRSPSMPSIVLKSSATDTDESDGDTHTGGPTGGSVTIQPPNLNTWPECETKRRETPNVRHPSTGENRGRLGRRSKPTFFMIKGIAAPLVVAAMIEDQRGTTNGTKTQSMVPWHQPASAALVPDQSAKPAVMHPDHDPRSKTDDHSLVITCKKKNNDLNKLHIKRKAREQTRTSPMRSRQLQNICTATIGIVEIASSVRLLSVVLEFEARRPTPTGMPSPGFHDQDHQTRMRS